MRHLLLITLLMVAAVTNAQRKKYNFNQDWLVHVGDVPNGVDGVALSGLSWKPVTLPYAWNEDEAFKKDIAELSTGIAWYKKKFTLPSSAKGQKVFIEFEGIRQAGEFYINGKSIGIHENGVMAFGFDVTDAVKYDGLPNEIIARIDNSWDYKEKSTNTKFQWEDKNFNANYGGITKNVYLHITAKLYQTLPLYSSLKTTGVYIYADHYDMKSGTATIHASSEIKNEMSASQQFVYQVAVIDTNGKVIKQFSGETMNITPGAVQTVNASATVSGLHFWSWGYGYLYTIQTTLKITGQQPDVVQTKTGFRKTAFQDGMIYLNDRVMMVHGYAQRTTNEWPAIGASVPAWLSDYSNGLMVEGNANLVRWMHVTPWKQDIESCDRVGLMMSMQAGDAEADVNGVRWEQRKALMKDAIIYNRNNPSIIFYECGNKGISEDHMKEMKAIRDAYDPQGGRAIGSREMLDSKTAEYGGEMLYTNKSARIPLWAMEYSRDEGSRKYWDEYTPPYHKDGDGPLYKGEPAKEYNRNMESHAVENVKRWYEFWRERPGTGKRVSAGGVNIVFSETNTHHRGAENYRRSGEVDALRIRKENFYANQVMWDGWVNPERQHIHIIGHWNYTSGVKKDILVVSTADQVELFVNGMSQGFGTKSDGFLFTFKNIAWQPGSIVARGYDIKHTLLCADQLNTVGEPVALRLKAIPRPTPFMADGHDLALVEVEVIDAKGSRCPTALNTIHFTIDGPAEWRGGMAIGPDNFILAKDFPVEGGVNRFLIRSTTTPGTITIKATADGVKETTLVLHTQAFSVNKGLAEILPADGLTGSLQRGPTPSTPSFQLLRTAINVSKATAGAHADSAFASYDDNERTEWVNDGTLRTAWITYELERAATINEITLKLNNFRSKSYPLIITVDGKEIFNGTTPTSLGYCTLACKPVKGKQIKIQLAGNAQMQNNGSGVEVSGKKLDDGVSRNDANAKGTLSILEVEFYEAVPGNQ